MVPEVSCTVMLLSADRAMMVGISLSETLLTVRLLAGSNARAASTSSACVSVNATAVPLEKVIAVIARAFCCSTELAPRIRSPSIAPLVSLTAMEESAASAAMLAMSPTPTPVTSRLSNGSSPSAEEAAANACASVRLIGPPVIATLLISAWCSASSDDPSSSRSVFTCAALSETDIDSSASSPATDAMLAIGTFSTCKLSAGSNASASATALT